MFVTTILNAQIKRNPVSSVYAEESKEEATFLNTMTADIKVGNIGIFNALSLSCKANAGYPINRFLSAGIGAKVFYTQIFVRSGPDPSYTDIGGFLYTRAKIFEKFYLQGEYHLTSFDYISSFLPGAEIAYPSLGAGYVSGERNWKFGFEINFLFNNLAREYQNSFLEYWAGGFYNF